MGKIEIRGLESILETELRQELRPGEVLDLELIRDFYRDHQSQLPQEDPPEDVKFDRHVGRGIADLFFDFRPCPKMAH